jgi:hypothetical protein
MNCANSLSHSFPYGSLSLLVNNHFTQVAPDLVRALEPSHSGHQKLDSPQYVYIGTVGKPLGSLAPVLLYAEPYI